MANPKPLPRYARLENEKEIHFHPEASYQHVDTAFVEMAPAIPVANGEIIGPIRAPSQHDGALGVMLPIEMLFEGNADSEAGDGAPKPKSKPC